MADFQNTFERKEIKYILTPQQHEAFVKGIEGYAKEDQYGSTQIYNIYYDTPHFSLIRNSLDKPSYKEKLRLRCYGVPKEDSISFIEIKKKYKGIVYKRRIAMPYENAIRYLNHGCPSGQDSQIAREIDYFLLHYRPMRPAMAIAYTREAYAGVENPQLRLTFDHDLVWSVENLDLTKGVMGEKILPESYYLLELKIAAALPRYLSDLMTRLEIYPASVSKYGEGFKAYAGKKMADNGAWIPVRETKRQEQILEKDAGWTSASEGGLTCA